MTRRPPPWLDSPMSVDDTERFRLMSPDERLMLFVQACELSAAVLKHRSDRDVVLSHRTPLPEESEHLWLRLVAEGRHERTT